MMEQTELAMARRVQETAGRLLDRLEQAVRELDAVTVTRREKHKLEDGETVTEFTEKLPRKKGLVDRGGLKQLTGVLKDLQDILCSDPEQDLQERQLRLQRLARELEDTAHDDAVTVVLEGEADDFAG